MHLRIGMAAAVLLAAGLSGPALGAAERDGGRAAYARGEFARALELLRPEAEAGDVEAQFIVAYLLDAGRDVAADPAQAVGWYRRAAEAGHARAQHNLGLALVAGRGTAADAAEAAAWLRRAAEQDFGPAQLALGDLYERGAGIDADPVEAHLWFSLAARNDVDDAKKRRRRVADAMTPRQIALAEMRARHFRERLAEGDGAGGAAEPGDGARP